MSAVKEAYLALNIIYHLHQQDSCVLCLSSSLNLHISFAQQEIVKRNRVFYVTSVTYNLPPISISKSLGTTGLNILYQYLDHDRFG